MKDRYEGRAITSLRQTLSELLTLRATYIRTQDQVSEKYPESKGVFDKYINSVSRDIKEVERSIDTLKRFRNSPVLSFLFGLRG